MESQLDYCVLKVWFFFFPNQVKLTQRIKGAYLCSMEVSLVRTLSMP
jgi:hypothetical protein